MKVVICYKLVPDVSNVKVKADRTLDLSECEWSISQYDLNATEAANRLVASNEGSTLTALTFGGDITDNSKLRKAILARGPHDLVIVKDEAAGSADTYATAKILAEAIEKIGDVDVVVFGEGSGDMYVQQTGSMVGAMLGWNTVNSVNALSMADGKLNIGRLVEECTENLELTLPAVVSVTSDICPPKIAAMRDILAAGKKPCVAWTSEDVGTGIENKSVTESILAPMQTDRKKIVSGAADEDHINAVAAVLRSVM